MPPDWLRDLAADPDRQGAAVRLGAEFLAAPAAERAVVAAGWDFGVPWPYPRASRLACVTGERFSPRERIVSSLVLDSLYGEFGKREHLISLSHTLRSCELVGLSPAEVLHSVGEALPDAHAALLLSFLGRPPEQRAAAIFGLVEIPNDDGEIEIEVCLPPVRKA